MPELTRADFDAVLGFVATGGYALASYERYRRLKLDDADGRYRSPTCGTCALSDERRHHRRGAGPSRCV
jgi:hypothetical protein